MSRKPIQEWDVEIVEGSKPYTLHLKLFKSRLNILDDEGNGIAVDKRDGKIKIERLGKEKVEFHKEDR